MDKICVWLEKLILWVDKCGPPPIMWVGMAGGRFHNPPAPHIEIVFMTEGECPALSIGDRKVCLRSGEASLHSVHFGNKSEPGDFKGWCIFLDVGDEREFESLCKSPLFCSISVTRRTELEAAFANLSTRCYRYGTGPEKGYLDPRPLFAGGQKPPAKIPMLLVKNALLDLLVILLEEARQGDNSSTSEYPPSVSKAIEFMSTNLNSPDLSLPAISRAAGLSVDHFGRFFRERVGISPMRWLQELRVRQSRFLLERSALLVEEIATEVGFQDPFHFSRVFKTHSGMSPTEYRERHSPTNASPKRYGRKGQ